MHSDAKHCAAPNIALQCLPLVMLSFERKIKMRLTIVMIALATFAMGCSSIPQKRSLKSQVETDTQGVDAEIIAFDTSTQVATIRYHHSIVYGKTSAVKYRFDGNTWQRIEESSNQTNSLDAPSSRQ